MQVGYGLMKNRDRTYLTSIQVTHQQKDIIDEAWDQYSDSKSFISRGEFLALMCLNLLRGEMEQPEQAEKEKSTNDLDINSLI